LFSDYTSYFGDFFVNKDYTEWIVFGVEQLKTWWKTLKTQVKNALFQGKKRSFYIFETVYSQSYKQFIRLYVNFS